MTTDELKEMLDRKFDEQDKKLDKKLDEKFKAQDEKLDAKFKAFEERLDEKLDMKFALILEQLKTQNSKINEGFSSMKLWFVLTDLGLIVATHYLAK